MRPHQVGAHPTCTDAADSTVDLLTLIHTAGDAVNVLGWLDTSGQEAPSALVSTGLSSGGSVGLRVD